MKSPLGRLSNVGPPHYQDALADLIRIEKPLIVVETGLYLGLGAEYILQALDFNGKGHLYSIDPMNPNHFTNGATPAVEAYESNPIIHPRFTHVKALSQDAILPLFEKVGPFDIFIHDSDHSFECQSFEYEAAWKCVRSGGIIVSDDCYWGVPCHHAWDLFLASHGPTTVTVMKNAQWIRKP
jgi:predicted O-methyltransferase YrrM